MSNKRMYIDDRKRLGIRKMLKYFVEKYKTSNSEQARKKWRDIITFCAKMQKKQFYSEQQQTELNELRALYKTLKKSAGKYEDTIDNLDIDVELYET